METVPTDRRRDCRVSVVLPVYNEAAVLSRLHAAVVAALEPVGGTREILFVNDGSTDGSSAALDELASRDSSVRVLHLSRNFGHQAAVQAGLRYASGDAVVVMDSDLQDDPQAIPKMLAAWRDGYDVVYAVREKRKEAAWKRVLFYAFYRVLNSVSVVPFPADAGNFGLLDRNVAQHVADLPESDRYFAGLRGWVGFRQTGVPVERMARYDARPRVSLRGLFRLAKTAVFSFSAAPLSLFYLIAVLSLLACLGCSSFVLYFKLIAHRATPGWTSTVLVASFFGAVNALGIAVLGEYIVRIYDQVRGRPKFIVARETRRSSAREGTVELPTEELAALLESAREMRGLLASGSESADADEPLHVP